MQQVQVRVRVQVQAQVQLQLQVQLMLFRGDDMLSLVVVGRWPVVVRHLLHWLQTATLPMLGHHFYITVYYSYYCTHTVATTLLYKQAL